VSPLSNNRRVEQEDVTFEVDVRAGPEGTVVTPRGELDIATAGELRDALAAVEGPLTLDLSALRFVDTSGLRLILEVTDRARRDGRAFAVVPGVPGVQRLFEMAGVAELVPFTDGPPRGTS
jgi:anti-anti-sigma factor